MSSDKTGWTGRRQEPADCVLHPIQEEFHPVSGESKRWVKGTSAACSGGHVLLL